MSILDFSSQVLTVLSLIFRSILNPIWSVKSCPHGLETTFPGLSLINPKRPVSDDVDRLSFEDIVFSSISVIHLFTPTDTKLLWKFLWLYIQLWKLHYFLYMLTLVNFYISSENQVPGVLSIYGLNRVLRHQTVGNRIPLFYPFYLPPPVDLKYRPLRWSWLTQSLWVREVNEWKPSCKTSSETDRRSLFIPCYL